MHSVVLSSRIGGIDTKENASIESVEKINTLDPPPLGIQEVAIHPVAPSIHYKNIALYITYFYILRVHLEHNFHLSLGNTKESGSLCYGGTC